MAMPICRVCGVNLSINTDCKALEDYLQIYSQLTAIRLDEEKDLHEFKVCNICVEKLNDFERFRKVCIQVHRQLLNVKLEQPENDYDQETTHVVKREPADNEDSQKSDSSGLSDDDNAEDDDEDDIKPLMPLVEMNDNTEEDSEQAKPKKQRAKYGSLKNQAPKTRIPIYSCDQCPRKFRVMLRLNAHKRTHDGLKPFECEICGKDFAKWNNLKTHHIQKHTESKISIPCEFYGCGQTFATRQGLKRHWLRTHDPNYVVPETTGFVCDTCGKTFTTNGALKKHKFIHTPNEMPFVCIICGKKFPTSHKLKEHTMRHEGIKNHTCSYCGLRKTTMHELKTHINNIHAKGRTYPCDICATEFSNIGNLNRHVKIVHLGLKPYVCQVCERAFGKSDHLKRHMKSHNMSTSISNTFRVPGIVYEDLEDTLVAAKMESAVEKSPPL